MTQGFFYVVSPGFDDDDLEEIEELLWRGYAPSPYPRHDWYVWIPEPQIPSYVPVQNPKKRGRKPKPKPVVAVTRAQGKDMTQVVQYRCDRCGLVEDRTTVRWLWLRIHHSEPYPVPWPRPQPARSERFELCEQCEKALITFMRNNGATG